MFVLLVPFGLLFYYLLSLYALFFFVGSLPYNTKRIEATVVVIQHFVNKTELNY